MSVWQKNQGELAVLAHARSPCAQQARWGLWVHGQPKLHNGTINAWMDETKARRKLLREWEFQVLRQISPWGGGNRGDALAVGLQETDIPWASLPILGRKMASYLTLHLQDCPAGGAVCIASTAPSQNQEGEAPSPTTAAPRARLLHFVGLCSLIPPSSPLTIPIGPLITLPYSVRHWPAAYPLPSRPALQTHYLMTSAST